MIGQYPTDSSNPCRCSHDAVESDLANLHKVNGSGGCVDNEMIKDVLIRVYK
jgi:hypothetical protein